MATPPHHRSLNIVLRGKLTSTVPIKEFGQGPKRMEVEKNKNDNVVVTVIGLDENLLDGTKELPKIFFFNEPYFFLKTHALYSYGGIITTSQHSAFSSSIFNSDRSKGARTVTDYTGFQIGVTSYNLRRPVRPVHK